MKTSMQRIIFALLTLLLYSYIAYQSSSKAELILYKISLISIAALIGYWIDLLLFKNFRPTDLSLDHIQNTKQYSYLMNKVYRDSDYAEDKNKDSKQLDIINAKIKYIEFVLPVSILRRAIIISACILAVSLGI